MLMILFCMLGFAIVAAFVKFICWCFGLAFNIKVALGIYAKERGYCLLRDINGGYILIGELGIEKCE